MSTRWRYRVGILAAAAVLILWTVRRHEPEPPVPPPITITAPIPGISPITTPKVPIESPAASPEIIVADFATELERTLIEAENPDAHLQAVEQVLFFYRRAFGENPVGQNEDITAALLGANPQRLALLPPGSPAIKDGQLIDPWGSPYWFHPVSGQEMEIRSAGPDRELFTADDLPGIDRAHADENNEEEEF